MAEFINNKRMIMKLNVSNELKSAVHAAKTEV